MTTTNTTSIVAMLKGIFPDLDRPALKALLREATLANYPAGHMLCHADEVEERFYIIFEGKVEVFRTFGGQRLRLSTKGPGAFVGETALVLEQPRTADVITVEPVSVLEIRREDFTGYMHAHPQAALAITRMAMDQLRVQTTRLNRLLGEQAIDPDEHRVFISYSRKDAAFVRKIVAGLEEQGVSVWLDQFHIPPGVNWDDAIDEALNMCRAMLLVLSPAAMASEAVKSEWKYFQGHLNRPVVPVRYQNCDIPYRHLANLQHIDFISQGYEAAFSQLVDALQAALSTEAD
jgi:CRP-like cAMP-binding protein